jgi:hypothetical protein
MSKIIKFSNAADFYEYPPQPASQLIPDWYKNTFSYLGEKGEVFPGGQVGATIKKCMPVFDALTAGYIIYSQSDVYVSQDNGKPYYLWARGNALDFHTVIQAVNHPNVLRDRDFPKWRNDWIVKTPKGYSCLFLNPLHRDIPFTIMEGIVDTDDYSLPVGLPFVLKDPKFEGTIPAGTPIAQVIPFKRESYKMEIEAFDKTEYDKVHNKLRAVFYNGYKKMYWNKKEYK